MNNATEAFRRLREAEAFLNTAEKIFTLDDFRATVQNAQSSIELSAKAIIAYFAEPEWTHNPSEQLLRITEEKREEFQNKWGEEFLLALRSLAEDVKKAAPWHSWSIYGRAEEAWVSATELCAKEIAQDLLERARKSYAVAKKFLGSLGYKKI